MSTFTEYDPQNVIVVIAGNTITGFAEGTMVKASRNADAFTVQVGAGGDVVRTKNADKTGAIELTLQQTSPSNTVLSALAALDEKSAQGVGAAQVTDVGSLTTLAHAAHAWVKKIADLGRGKEQTDTTWVIDCADLELSVGGANTVT